MSEKGGAFLSVWCEKFGFNRDFRFGFCADADDSEDCRNCPANKNKGKAKKKAAI